MFALKTHCILTVAAGSFLLLSGCSSDNDNTATANTGDGVVALSEADTPSETVVTPDTNTPSDSDETPDTNTPSDSVVTPDTNTPSDSDVTPDTNTPPDSVETPDTNTPSDSVETPDTNTPSDSDVLSGERNVAQLPIIITDVPTSLPTNGVSLINYTVDGVSVFSADGFDLANLNDIGVKGTAHEDIDGDGIPEVSIRLREPDDLCSSTSVYIPSRQARSVTLDSADLSGYTRIRKVVEQNSVGYCLDDSPWIGRIGDLDGDGIAEFVSTRNPPENMIINGNVPTGTLFDPATASPYAIQLASDTEVWAVGDVNGDGIDDLGVGFYYGNSGVGSNYKCGIVKGKANLPATIDAKKLQQYELLGLWGVNADRNIDCPRSGEYGDFNGDGATDLVIESYDNFSDRIVYGGRDVFIDDNAINSADQVQKNCASSATCDYESTIVDVGDFDADGYADAYLRVDNQSISPYIQQPNALILYGSVDGLPSFTRDSPPPDSQVTRVYGVDPRRTLSLTNIGDMNGDGAGDISTGGVYVLFGTPGKRQPYLLLDSLNGANGQQWVKNDISEINFGDWNGDGVNDSFIGDNYIPGYAPFRTANDVESVFIWQGRATSDIRWSVPGSATNVATVRVEFNDRALETLDRDVTRYTIDHASSGESGTLRLQSLDMNGEVIGEAVRWMGPLGSEYDSLIIDTEQSADGKSVPAANYAVRAELYSSSSAELFWNVTKRFVLIWKDDEIIARTEGNSFLLNAAEHGTGQYFVTKDYFGEIPSNNKPFEFTGGTLNRSNVVDVDLF